MESIESILRTSSGYLRAATHHSSRQRALFAAVSEPTPRSIREVTLLARSIRTFGGSQAGADIRIYFVDQIPSEAELVLGELGVDVRVAARFSDKCPHANKLAMFADVADYDYLIAVDSDIVVVGDVSDHLVGQSVGVRMGTRDHLGTPLWRKLYEHFGLQEPAERYVSLLSRTEMIAPYTNSGVLVVASEHVDALRESWSEWTLRLIDARAAVPELATQDNVYFTDQISLALALIDSGLPRRALPLALNYQTCYPSHPMYEPEAVTPLLLHHHHRWTEEGLSPALYPLANEAIARVNRLLFGSAHSAHPAVPRRQPGGLRQVAISHAKKISHAAPESDHEPVSQQPA